MSAAAAIPPRKSAPRSRRRRSHNPWRSTISQGRSPRTVPVRNESLLSSAARTRSNQLHRPRPTARPSASEARR